jgi:photosystem II stability/assembly factor-like uncharacterized protein
VQQIDAAPARACRRMVGRRLQAGCALLVGLMINGATPSDTAPAGWRLVFDHPIVGKYEDISFGSPTNGWIVASNGEILSSTDAGMTWKVQQTGLGDLRSVHFVSGQRGFAGTLSGQLYSTNDSGTTWMDITSKLPVRPSGICGITHYSGTIHAVGRFSGGRAEYFRSTDGGESWVATDLSALAYGLVDVAFLSASVGFIGGMSKSQTPGEGNAIILRTTNGGDSWEVVYTAANYRSYLWKLFPVNDSLVVGALQSEDGTFRIARTEDAGISWSTIVVASGQRLGVNLQAIGFLDEQTGWVGGFNQGMWATTDGGRTWHHSPLPYRTINRFAVGGGTMIAAASRGVLRYDVSHNSVAR